MNPKIYLVRKYSDKVEIFYEDKIFIKVKRTFSFWGKMLSTFTVEEKIILKSTYDIVFYKKYITITYQDLESPLTLRQARGDYFLYVNNLSLALKRSYFKNPIFTISDRNLILGTVDSQIFGFIGSYLDYTITLHCNEKDEIYCLIRFLIELEDLPTSN